MKQKFSTRSSTTKNPKLKALQDEYSDKKIKKGFVICNVPGQYYKKEKLKDIKKFVYFTQKR